MIKEKCKHTRITVSTSASYRIKQGWEAFQKQQEIDMEKYKVDIGDCTTVCEDCGEELSRI